MQVVLRSQFKKFASSNLFLRLISYLHFKFIVEIVEFLFYADGKSGLHYPSIEGGIL